MKKRLPILILTVYFLSACSVQPIKVEGTAMLPALNNGDKILVDKRLNNLKRGDVVTLLYPRDQTKSYIKRVIGLPGEKIEIKQGKTYLNGEILDEPYVDEKYNQAKLNFPAQIVPEHQYFVMGDNRDNSSNSRFGETLDEKLITGKYFAIYSKTNN